jgi:hypothetical protein
MNKPKTPLTSCCKAKMYIRNEDGRTNYYVCVQCDMPVDPDGSNPVKAIAKTPQKHPTYRKKHCKIHRYFKPDCDDCIFIALNGSDDITQEKCRCELDGFLGATTAQNCEIHNPRPLMFVAGKTCKETP